jgi:hypothetical protein
VVAATVDVGVDCPLTATHFSFFASSLESAGLSVASSSDVTLSSVSASDPVLLSASEPEDEDSEDDVAEGAAGVFSVVVVEAAGALEDSLFSRRAFLALRRASFLSSF